jgi:hypothetical protein
VLRLRSRSISILSCRYHPRQWHRPSRHRWYRLCTLLSVYHLLQDPDKKHCLILTNLSSTLYQNFPENAVLGILKGAPQFLVNNPIALKRKYLKLEDDPIVKRRRMDLLKAVKVIQQKALEMLVNLFDWLNSLEIQWMTVSGSLYKKSQIIEATTSPRLDEGAHKKGHGKGYPEGQVDRYRLVKVSPSQGIPGDNTMTQQF